MGVLVGSWSAALSNVVRILIGQECQRNYTCNGIKFKENYVEILIIPIICEINQLFLLFGIFNYKRTIYLHSFKEMKILIIPEMLLETS